MKQPFKTMIVIEYLEVCIFFFFSKRLHNIKIVAFLKRKLQTLQSWSSLIEDERLGLVSRLQLAIGALELVDLFDTFPVGMVAF